MPASRASRLVGLAVGLALVIIGAIVVSVMVLGGSTSEPSKPPGHTSMPPTVTPSTEPPVSTPTAGNPTPTSEPPTDPVPTGPPPSESAEPTTGGESSDTPWTR